MIMRTLLLLGLLCCAFPATADESLPLLYSRAQLKLVRLSLPELPWRAADAKSNTDIVFDTEIRDGTIFYKQDGWISLISPESLRAILLVFGAPMVAPIPPSQNYAPLDILLLDHQGTVLEIFPNIRLSTLQDDIYPAKPVSAFLLLRGGASELYTIKPGDYVLYELFKRPPRSLGPQAK